MDRVSNDEQLTPSHSAGKSDWTDYLDAVTRRLWLVALTTGLGLGFSIVHLARVTPIFAATSVLLIEQRAAQVVRMESVEQADPRNLDVVNTLVETIRSQTFLHRVVDSLNLNENPAFFSDNENVTTHTKGEALGVLSGCIKTSLRRSTRLVDITAEHPNPEVARFLADGVGKEFIRFGNDQRVASSQTANEFIGEEAAKLRTKLRHAEEDLQKSEAMQSGPMEQSQDINVDQLKDLNARYSAARAERLSLETDQAKAVQYANNPAELLKLPSVVKQPIVAPLLAALVDKESNLPVLSQQYKAKHPKYIAAVTEIGSLKASLNQKATEAAALISSMCATARDNEEKLSQSMRAQEKVLVERNRKTLEYNVMKRDYDADRAIYESMQARMKEIDITKNIDGSPIKIVDSAAAPGAPVRPNRVKAMTMGSMLGFLIGVAGAIGLDRVRRRLRTVAQAEAWTGLPVLGTLMKRKKATGASLNDYLLSAKGCDFEAFRSLQVSISVRTQNKEHRTMMVTSAIPGEGKTYVSTNLAMTFAHSGIKTLLIDGDVHKQTCSQVFTRISAHGDNTSKLGFYDLLAGRAALEEVVHPAEIQNLFFVAAGENRQDSADVLTAQSLESVLAAALTQFDQIIIDTPPVLALSDSLIIARKAQTICFVVAAGVTECRAVEHACKLLSQSGKQPLGIVLNRMEKQWGDGGYYGYYYAEEYYGKHSAKA